MKAISTILLSFIACSVLVSCDLKARANQSLESQPRSPVDLAGTHWRLVEFQSMDDSQGTKKPTDPDAYTMHLMAGGRVAFRLDCIRGMGNWSVEPSADGTSGTISFSHLAVTKAMCPPPSMGEKLALDTQYMRGYLLRDGSLNISLMADGGIYVWEPTS